MRRKWASLNLVRNVLYEPTHKEEDIHEGVYGLFHRRLTPPSNLIQLHFTVNSADFMFTELLLNNFSY